MMRKVNVKNTEGDKVIKYRTFPNLACLTDKIIKCVKYLDENIRIVPKNYTTVRNLHTRVKDKIRNVMQTMLIYGISCLDCIDLYLGMTYQQRLLKRGEQNLSDIEAVHRLRGARNR
jgi:hypothetical protein